MRSTFIKLLCISLSFIYTVAIVNAQNCPGYSSTVTSLTDACADQTYYFEIANNSCNGTISFTLDADYGPWGSEITWEIVSIFSGDTLLQGAGSDYGTDNISIGPIDPSVHGQTFQLYVYDSFGDGLDFGAYIDIIQNGNILTSVTGNFGSSTNQGFGPTIAIHDAIIAITTPSGVVLDTVKSCKNFNVPLVLYNNNFCNTLNVSLPWVITCDDGANTVLASGTHNVVVYPKIASASSDVVDISWNVSTCAWDVTPQNDCDNLDIGTIFTIAPNPATLTQNACGIDSQYFTVDYLGISSGPNCCSTGGPLLPVNYSTTYSATNGTVSNSPFGGINNSIYFNIPPNTFGGEATNLNLSLSMSGYDFPDPPGTGTDDSYWVTVYVDGNIISDLQYTTSSFSDNFNLSDITAGYDENSVIEIFIYPNSFSSGGVNTTYVPGVTPVNEGEWSATSFAVNFTADFEELIPSPADCDFIDTLTTQCCTPAFITNVNDTVCSGSTGGLTAWTTALSAANTTCLVYSSVTPVAGSILPDASMPTGANTSCAPINQTVSAYAYCDANGSGAIDIGDTYTILSTFNLRVHPAPPTLITNTGGCGTAPSASIICNGTSLLSQSGTAPSGLPCGTGTNTTNLSGTFTAANIAVSLGNADAACYSDETYNLTASCPQNPIITASVDITGCDSLMLLGTMYTANTSFNDTIIGGASNGCDSITTYNVMINNSVITTSSSTSCIPANVGVNQTGPYTMANGCDSTHFDTVTLAPVVSSSVSLTACDSITVLGNLYVSDSIFNDTIIGGSASGCDSVTTYNINVNNSTTGTDTLTACDSLTWINGITYTSSNTTAQHTLTNAAGCDSVVTLNLTISNSTTGTDTLTACDSLTWINGITYTSSNTTAQHTLTNAAGCDSVVTLNLTISNSTTGTDTLTACDSLTWINGITYTSSNTTAQHTLTNAAGCDSVVTLNLTINNSITGTDTLTACDSLTWINGITYTSSNTTAQHTLTNAAGCDSVVTLNLTINYSITVIDTSYNCELHQELIDTFYSVSTVTGCDSTYISVELSNGIDITANASEISINQGEEVQLYTTGSTAENYVWEASSGISSNDSLFINMPDETTMYIVTAYNGQCEDTDSIEVEVISDLEPLIPNSFTPNGDGNNDVFRVVNYSVYDNISMIVYNRWGDEIFNENNSNPGWDGTYGLKDQPIDYYNYVISVTLKDGTVKTTSGSLALFR